jgi:hypothetical protein
VVVALTVVIPFLLEPTSVREADAAVEVEPRGSLGCISGERTTVLLVVADASSAEGWSKPRLDGVGVGAGEIKATFFCTSLVPLVVLMLPFPVLRELGPAKSGSARGDIVRVTTVVSIDSSSATSERGPLECVTDMGVYSAGDMRESLIGGSGREESSGRGLKEVIEVGVPTER